MDLITAWFSDSLGSMNALTIYFLVSETPNKSTPPSLRCAPLTFKTIATRSAIALISERKLTQIEAAELLGIDQHTSSLPSVAA